MADARISEKDARHLLPEYKNGSLLLYGPCYVRQPPSAIIFSMINQHMGFEAMRAIIPRVLTIFEMCKTPVVV